MNDSPREDQQRTPEERPPTDSPAARSTDQPQRFGELGGAGAADASSRSVRGELARDASAPTSPGRTERVYGPHRGSLEDEAVGVEEVDPAAADIDRTTRADVQTVHGPDGRVLHTDVTFSDGDGGDSTGGAGDAEAREKDGQGGDGAAPEGQNAARAWKALGDTVVRVLSDAARSLGGHPTRASAPGATDSARAPSGADATDTRRADPASGGAREGAGRSSGVTDGRGRGNDTAAGSQPGSARASETVDRSDGQGADHVDEYGNRWQVDGDGNVTVTGSDGTMIHSSPDGSSVVTAPDGTVTFDRADGRRSVSNPDRSVVETDRDGTTTHTSPAGDRWTWSDRDGRWIRFDAERHGSRWDRDPDTGRWTERAGPHPTRPEGVWISPDGRSTVTERNGHLFAHSNGGYSIRFGGEPGRAGPEAGRWREVNREVFASTLALNERLDAEQDNPELVAKQAYTDAVMAATQRFQETYLEVAEKVAGRIGGPVGVVFEATMDKIRTWDAASRASTETEGMRILAEGTADVMSPRLPGGVRTSGTRPHRDATTDRAARGRDVVVAGPLTTSEKNVERSKAQVISERVTGNRPGGTEVHHRIPLEYAHLQPELHPNRLDNLVRMTDPQAKEASAMSIHNRVHRLWDAHMKHLPEPTRAEVEAVADSIDRQIRSEFGRRARFLHEE